MLRGGSKWACARVLLHYKIIRGRDAPGTLIVSWKKLWPFLQLLRPPWGFLWRGAEGDESCMTAKGVCRTNASRRAPLSGRYICGTPVTRPPAEDKTSTAMTERMPEHLAPHSQSKKTQRFLAQKFPEFPAKFSRSLSQIVPVWVPPQYQNCLQSKRSSTKQL